MYRDLESPKEMEGEKRGEEENGVLVLWLSEPWLQATEPHAFNLPQLTITKPSVEGEER